MAASATLKINDPEHITVVGELNFANITALYEQGLQLLSNTVQVTFDFAQVTRSDSSALALLTAWWRYAQQHDKKLRFVDLPPALVEVAKLSNLSSILRLSETV